MLGLTRLRGIHGLSLRGLSLTLFAAVTLVGCECGTGFNSPLKVAVVMDVGETWDLNALEWAKDNINAAGGIQGVRPISLEYYESATVNGLSQITRELVDDPSVVAIIGPGTSQQVVEAARRFSPKQKLMISPAATAGEIYRTFGDDDYIWRTTESDIAQTEIMVLSALDSGATKIGLLTHFSLYGDTFFDWFGFFAAEVGYTTDDVQVSRFGQDGGMSPQACVQPVIDILDTSPDVLFAVPETDDQIRCMVNTVAEYNSSHGSSIRLYLSSRGYRSDVLKELGELAEGVEGITLAPAPESGFELAYKHRYEANELPPFAANIYDALLLVAYGLEHSGGQGGPQLAASLKEIVSYRGEPVGWDGDGVRDALLAIRENRRPNLSGATGTLTYADGTFTDLFESSYGQWRFENGHMVFSAYYTTGNNSMRARSSTSILEARASSSAQQDISVGTYDPGVDQEDLWVVIMAFSKGWQNYRHEADALRQYQMFKERGIPDGRIILAIQDDIAFGESNTEQGVVRNEVGGANLYVDVEIDYSAGDISLALVEAILGGVATPEFPTVVESTHASNVYVYMVGHGGPMGVAIGAGSEEDAYATAEDLGIEVLSPEGLLDTLCSMQENAMYRRAMVVIESCFSGVMGEVLDVGCGNDQPVVDSAIRVVVEEPGAICPEGGQVVEVGPDANEDGVPDSVDGTYPICSDDLGAGLVSVTSEPVGENCSEGGLRVDLGSDADGSGWLGLGEIVQTVFVCKNEAVTHLNGAVMLTASNSSENSISYAYDEGINVWLADQFSTKLANAMNTAQSSSLYDLYNEVYLSVSGSHVGMYNALYFGNVREVMIEEFMRRED